MNTSAMRSELGYGSAGGFCGGFLIVLLIAVRVQGFAAAAM